MSHANETVRRTAKRSSWRGSPADLRSDVEFASELLARRTPEDDPPRPKVSVDLGGKPFLGEGRTRTYDDLDGLVADLAITDPEEISEIKVSIYTSPAHLTLTLTPERGAELSINGNPVDAEGIRSEMDHHLSARESLPEWTHRLTTALALGFCVATLFCAEIYALEVRPRNQTLLAVLVSLGALFVLAVAGRLVVKRTYPRLEIVAGGESREGGFRKHASQSARYVLGALVAAVLGAVADHFLR